VFGVLPCALEDALRARFDERRSAEDPGAIRQRMNAFDFFRFSGLPQRLRRDAEKPRSVV